MAVIRVHAQFPKHPSTLASSEWTWVHCLTIPVDKLKALKLSNKPFKWIRYSIGIIVGVEGHFTRRQDDPTLPPQDVELFDSDIDSLTGVNIDDIDLYYHLIQDARLHMFPFDPDLAGTRLITSTGSSPRVSTFRDEVVARDVHCVVTEAGATMCAAVHLIAHSKGDSVRTSWRLVCVRYPDGLLGLSIFTLSPPADMEPRTS